MAEIVGNGLALALCAGAALYLLWAAGLTFPFANEQALARSIIGRRGITRVPSRLSFLYICVLLLFAALAAFLMGGFSEQVPRAKPYLVPVGLLLTFVFLGRGIVGVLPAFERAAPEQPYLSLNRRIYSPLCALVGIGFLFLTLALPNWSWRLSQLFG
ncbi:DUF3995 domain-containing protein [Hyphomonas sp.]|uniref:DUF3995 domain-containing protein n=1 Tax=Hyphomonas sp. TaxID=87 RepID=UPI0025C5E3B1|nr:DUF3995 domain-containing protein [Hyphomonas sp.]MBI1399320.1 DUF3995 domain-containing protein [Hyphomonas sp.]